MVMMVFKFFYVAAWFMHLRFDSPLFTKFFVTGLVLATVVYGVTPHRLRVLAPRAER